MNKPFIEAEIHDLLSQVTKEEITFSRFVEIINERRQEVIDKVNAYTPDTIVRHVQADLKKQQ